MIKVIAIGNILLSDDGIGIKVINRLRNKIEKLSEDIEVILAGIDYYEFLEELGDDDYLIIVDASYLNNEVGQVCKYTLEECDSFLQNTCSDHDINLIKILRSERRKVKGSVITIEIGRIEYSLKISNELRKKFNEICGEVFERIEGIIKHLF